MAVNKQLNEKDLKKVVGGSEDVIKYSFKKDDFYHDRTVIYRVYKVTADHPNVVGDVSVPITIYDYFSEKAYEVVDYSSMKAEELAKCEYLGPDFIR